MCLNLTNSIGRFKSVITGTIATEHHTNWMDELDDSKKRYLLSEKEVEKLENHTVEEAKV